MEGKTPEGICLGSFNSSMPYLTALRFGASFPWEQEEGTIIIGCPVHVNQVVWRLRRIETSSPRRGSAQGATTRAGAAGGMEASPPVVTDAVDRGGLIPPG